jgi:predicted metalloprotease with PDZ domain
LRELLIGEAFSSLGLGESETALDLIKKAEEAADYPNYAYHLSLIYYVAGDKEKAWEYRGGKGMVGAQVKEPQKAENKGAEVVLVVPGGPAEKSGMLPGDVIIGLNGTEITGVTDFLNKSKKLEPGKTATIKVVREGKAQDLTLQVASAEALMESDRVIAPILAKRKTEAREYQQMTSSHTLDAYAEFLR